MFIWNLSSRLLKLGFYGNSACFFLKSLFFSSKRNLKKKKLRQQLYFLCIGFNFLVHKQLLQYVCFPTQPLCLYLSAHHWFIFD